MLLFNFEIKFKKVQTKFIRTFEASKNQLEFIYYAYFSKFSSYFIVGFYSL